MMDLLHVVPNSPPGSEVIRLRDIMVCMVPFHEGKVKYDFQAWKVRQNDLSSEKCWKS